MEFSNLKHLATAIYVNETQCRVLAITRLTGLGHQTFSRSQCSVSVFARPCSCCLDEGVIRISSKVNSHTAGDSP